MKNQKLFDKYSKGKHWENHPTAYAEFFVQFLQDMKFQGKIVDLGCGNGRDLNVFHKNGFETLGIDYDEKIIADAKTKYPTLAFQCANIEHLPFSDESIDAYFCINLIHYVDQKKALAEIMRTLKPGGRIYIHFNLQIIDEQGNLDYIQHIDDVHKLISDFWRMYFAYSERNDTEPRPHKHIFYETILKKPKKI